MNIQFLKKLHEITLKDVIDLDATKSANSLKKHWFIPLWMCKKEMEKLSKEIFLNIGGKPVLDIDDEFERLNAYGKIQIIEALYKALIIELGMRPRLNAWKIVLQKDYKDSPLLEQVLFAVKKHTGIDVSSPDDLKTVEDHLRHKIDKFNEMFPEPEPEQNLKEANLSKVIYSVFSYLGEPYNENMRLITFIELKAMAENQVRQSKTIQDEQD
jgi:hypothetical protein